MTSTVAICNRALAYLGEEPITDMQENSEAARRCNLLFAETRDAVLRAHPWNAALSRAELARVMPGPTWGWASAFQLPADPYCLRVVALTPGSEPYAIEGQWLMANIDSARILYICRITDPTLYDALLLDSIATRLAADLAESLTGDPRRAAGLWQLYGEKLREARRVDGQEGLLAADGVGPWEAAHM
ncbi:MAG: hypothetical protein RIE31_05110 [Alphaproteobacteria bacterium]